MTSAEISTVQKSRTVPGQRAATDSARAKRDPFFDNAKFLLIVLVVIGHNWYPLIGQSRAIKAAYMVVYAFHMPAFILLSGYFSRHFEATPVQVRKLIRSVLLPYAIFEIAYLAVVAKVDRQSFRLDLFTYPSFLCWFLIALFVWRLTTPVWRAVPRPVLVSVLVSLAAGLMNISTDFAFSRILQFLPWFVAGLSVKRKHFRWLHRRAVRLWAVAVLVVALPVSYLLAPYANAGWLDMAANAVGLGVGTVEYLEIRLGLLAVGTLLVAAVLALIPERRLWLTALGAYTMYPFLLHGLFVKAAQGLGLYGKVANGGPPAVVTLTLAAVALTLLLTTPPVRKAAGWAVEPQWPRLPWLEHVER
ncbi:MAG: acyltransferase family protein [Streptomycetaceae bacterium]|nr:acyltransferase family protein [Streptomycetaceae bacterium]